MMKVKKNKSRLRLILFIIIMLLVILLIGSIVYVVLTKKATEEYNEAAKEYNTLSKEYSELASKTAVENIENFPVSMGTLDIVGEDVISIIETIAGGNNVNKIKTDTQTIYDMIDIAKQDIGIMEQVTAPSEEWVINRLETVEGIDEIEAVTSDKDPNAMLNKEGGYISCIYFTLEAVDTSAIYGDSVVDKGTDAGGCIEVYNNLEDAEARCEYLAGFDNTIFYSGSYTIMGTSVIRITYILENEEQYEMTGRITEAFTRIE